MPGLLTLLIILQIIAMVYIIFETHQRYKADKKFWKQQTEISDEFIKQLKLQSELLEKGDVASEPEEENSSEE